MTMNRGEAMIRQLRRGHADERGIAVITAMLVSVVVVILGITSVAVAIHNSEASSYDRRRVQGVAASEAGLPMGLPWGAPLQWRRRRRRR
jgi:Tfp pilus assembly protein PilX